MSDVLTFRQGRAGDLHATFRIMRLTRHHTAAQTGVTTAEPPTDAEIDAAWERDRQLLEFIAAQAGSYWICEDGDEPVGYARVCHFGEMAELAELVVVPSHQGLGMGRALLQRCWPGSPTPQLGRVAIAAGTPADLTLHAEFGVMPITGHWDMRAYAVDYQERRSLEVADASEPAVVVLEAARAVAEWKRLEPPAIGHRRPRLHEFFARSRSCLATMQEDGERAVALCWVGTGGEIGPAVGASPEAVVPVVLQALDRVTKLREPETLGVFCATDSWWLLRRLGTLGFRVWWPSWVMSSIPLPGLDRYVPTRPSLLL